MFFFSRDLASWSEGQDRKSVLRHGDLLNGYFVGFEHISATMGQLYESMRLLTKGMNSNYLIPWRNSLMQGMQGFADSWLHSHISKFSATDGMPRTLSSQGAHTIDDVLLSLKLENKVGSTTASRLFGILEGTYKNLACIIDRAKSLLFDRRYVLLSRYFVDGVGLMLRLQTVIRVSMSLKNELPTLHSRVNAVYMYYKSFQVQGGSVYFCEFLKLCDVFTVLGPQTIICQL